MSSPGTDDLDPQDVIDRHVSVGGEDGQRYMRLMEANPAALGTPEGAAFLRSLAEAAERITDRELGVLLDADWRCRLVAGWLIGVDRRERFRAPVGARLLESRVVFAGHGYCFALARLGTADDADILTAYLDNYLRETKLRYDQDSAFGALQHLDARLGTHRAERFTRPGGLWQQWATANRADTTDHKQRIDILCFLVQEAVDAHRASRGTGDPA
ncbi:DUF6000 family protein [Actinokineospora spheciospongiae]|uniref:DUF6000 family protein n=1 Tax=Actinokineospora spheciospongiae TaxID=909613 RepID=UPI000D8F8EFE|nr:DUF6000 family protein [Actinokineospora spheciospongiae]PWW66710.1 hypothetical protein DFQ13_101226 [Actinokineospora spheciospongiae]